MIKYFLLLLLITQISFAEEKTVESKEDYDISEEVEYIASLQYP